MLGFGKKKTKDKTGKQGEHASTGNLPENTEEKTNRNEPDNPDASKKDAPGKKKIKLFSKKLILLLVLICVGASSYIVYALYFNQNDLHTPSGTYETAELSHLSLPEEMLRFSFEYFPDLYKSMKIFNNVMDLFEKEIARIDAIAQKYPDQIKIADREKKTWERSKNTLANTFLKIEKPVKETYVLFRVNKEQGLTLIKTRNDELTQLAIDALRPAAQMTRNLEPMEKIPQGFFKGTLYKLKKKFL